MKHIHHIIPKHMGGTDDPSNLIELTVEEHAEAHRLLYEQNGRIEDRIAWLGLTKMISSKEAINMILSQPKSEEWKAKNRKPKSITKNYLGNKNAINSRGTPKPGTSLALKGKIYDKVTCPHCNKTGGGNSMKRWHFGNCKQNG